MLSALLCGGAVCVSAGCRVGGGGDPDAARKRVIELEKELAAITGERDELRAKLAAAGTGADLASALPTPVSLEIDRFSGFDAGGADPASRVFRAYVRPLDGRGRFVQVLGSLNVRLTRGGAPIAARTLTPDELRDAYRSNMLGTHYEVLIDVPDASGAVTASATLTTAAGNVSGAREIGGR